METPILSEVERFVATLDPEYRRLFGWAQTEARDRDTGSNEFQVAARIEDAFWTQAKWLKR